MTRFSIHEQWRAASRSTIRAMTKQRRRYRTPRQPIERHYQVSATIQYEPDINYINAKNMWAHMDNTSIHK